MFVFLKGENILFYAILARSCEEGMQVGEFQVLHWEKVGVCMVIRANRDEHWSVGVRIAAPQATVYSKD